jgi:AcrR family transcriptional regulator
VSKGQDAPSSGPRLRASAGEETVMSVERDGPTSVTAAVQTRPLRGHDAPPFAFDDPLAALPDTAQQLLLAAKRIVASDGFDALTLNAIAVASGENKAMISYYFGNKAGLVAAVLDSVIHDECVASRQRMRHLDPEQRRQQLVREMRCMTDCSEEFQVFFELLPHVLRDETLRRRLALLYRWYWGAKLEWLGIGRADEALEDPDLLGLTQLLSAVIDGLAVQAAIDPDIDLAKPYRVFEKMLAGSLLALLDARVADAGRGRPGRISGAPA